MEVIAMETPSKTAVSEVYVFKGEAKASKRIAVRARDFHSISYRHSGKAYFKIGDIEIVSEANSITFMPKGISYETEVLEDTQTTVAHFKLDRDIEFRNPAVLAADDKELAHLFEKLLRRNRLGSSVNFSVMAAFYELLAKLESIERMKSREAIPKKISSAREQMLQRFSDPLFSIDTLAESIGVSASYLRREFSRAYGKSPIAYLKELRIRNAKILLHSGYMSIAEVAEQSGFSSTSYFIQVFHKTVGCSPARYRTENRIVY
jgi:AraC-like DNA-binding protein